MGHETTQMEEEFVDIQFGGIFIRLPRNQPGAVEIAIELLKMMQKSYPKEYPKPEAF